ncbi:MAG TPA: hypothetical protein VH396_11655 [Chitinophagaceae bacterium]|jgi:hypothetical protein
MKKILLAGVIIFIGFSAKTQSMDYDYKTALGVKFYPGAISLKSFTRDNKALEGLAYFYTDGVRFTGLYEIYGDINGAAGLKWYVGPGAHLGFWSDNWKKNYPERDAGVAFGIDGVLGLDYKFNGAPINVSLDWQPSFNFVGYNYFEGGWGGLGIRYTF